MRILFVKLSSIGDVIHTLPALSAVKRALPESEISWVVEKKSAEILRNNPLVSRLIEVDTKTLRRGNVLGKTLQTAKTQLRELRASEFDLTIDFQGLLKSASIAKLVKTKQRYGFSKRNLREPTSRILMSASIEVEPIQNIIFKNIELAEGALRKFLADEEFTLERENIEFSISTDGAHRKEARKIVKEAGKKFAILNPAGGWVTKLWHAEKFGQLADLLWEEMGLTSVISTAPGEKDLAHKALANSSSGKTIIAQPSLKGFYELTKRASIYVGGDTAPSHLAIAANCPTVGIFGPTEWWRNGSVDPEDICVERNDIDCRTDCHRRTCNKWICMDIPVETVFEAVRERLRLV
ncbi:MAG: lipopolysaccharide heptosyltransferase I [Acidobacteria bacterium]|nr:lipopolysaccharide heptosyltransferase I [Acidobacteriota bacterium]